MNIYLQGAFRLSFGLISNFGLMIILFLVASLALTACSGNPGGNMGDVSSRPHPDAGRHTQKPAPNRVIRISYPTQASQGQGEYPAGNEAAPNRDKWEKFNRGVFRFNTGVDAILLKPAARFYKFATPELLDTSISNFFSNLGDVGNAFNNLLQLKPRAAFNDSMRFVFNSSFGLGGFLDIASGMELEKHDEDFGQTLARWGVGSGPYIMLPLLGPSTLRDASARLSIDLLTDPVTYHDDALAIDALKLLDTRADLLSTEEAFNDLSSDTYSAMRDAWLQRRDYLIRDGQTNEQEQSDLIDELEALDKQ